MEHDESIGAVVVGLPPVPASVTVLATVTAAELPAAVARLRPRLGIVDLDAGRDAGIVAISALADQIPDVPVLASSAGIAHATVLDAVRAGAAGYAAGADPHTIAELVDAVVEGRPAFSPGLAELVLDAVADPATTAAPPLSPRESDVLLLVVEGLTARQIAGRLVLSPRTVENHVQRLLRKFDVPGRGALVRYAIEHGLA
ncbi:response regulator transcription factor [Pseudonocardia endophytica]|uniref:DNA-binding NarL/FixJ family response regulator n=1 Tax=Pseudonocardia endophytica TaxID=401976 RepID=A0A4R1HIT7_PSEEN|nr:response regulator transcription factor [Pseudonocardia endophytica]TCK20793.1 DNA-binding NarL/FixJ family response regulator [Pseudonocardia endophytica]